jgi:hypothetical protein
MLVKIVTFFLVGMAILAAFGRLKVRRRRAKAAPTAHRPGKCRTCGAPLVGRGPCPCGAGGPGN